METCFVCFTTSELLRTQIPELGKNMTIEFNGTRVSN